MSVAQCKCFVYVRVYLIIYFGENDIVPDCIKIIYQKFSTVNFNSVIKTSEMDKNSRAGRILQLAKQKIMEVV